MQHSTMQGGGKREEDEGGGQGGGRKEDGGGREEEEDGCRIPVDQGCDVTSCGPAVKRIYLRGHSWSPLGILPRCWGPSEEITVLNPPLAFLGCPLGGVEGLLFFSGWGPSWRGALGARSLGALMEACCGFARGLAVRYALQATAKLSCRWRSEMSPAPPPSIFI